MARLNKITDYNVKVNLTTLLYTSEQQPIVFIKLDELIAIFFISSHMYIWTNIGIY